MNKIPKAFLSICWASLLLCALTACDVTGLIDPLSDMLGKKITGLSVKADKVVTGLRPLRLEAKGLKLIYQKGADHWEIQIPDCRVLFDWTLTWETLPWPRVHLAKISVQRPDLFVRIPHPQKGGDWTQILRKVPAFRELEVRDLKGRLEYGNLFLRFNRGAQARASFSPERGGRMDFQIQGMEGRGSSAGFSFRADARGSLELNDFPEEPQFKGDLRISEGTWVWVGGEVRGVSGKVGLVWAKDHLRLAALPFQVREVAWKGKGVSFIGKGDLKVSGDLRGYRKPNPLWRLEAMEATWEAREFLFEQGKRRIKGQTTGQCRLDGPLPSPRVKARIAFQQTDFSLPPVETSGLQAEMWIQGKSPDFSLSVSRAEAVRTDWSVGARPLPLIRPETRFSGEIKGKSRKISLKDIELKTANWGTLFGNLFFDLEKDAVPQGQGKAEDFPLPRFIAHFLPRADEPFGEDVPCRGTFTWKRGEKGGPIDFKVSLTPSVLSFRVPRTDWEGEAIKASIETEGKWFVAERKVALTLTQDVSGGSFSRSPWIFLFDEENMRSRFQGSIEGRKEKTAVVGVLDVHYPPLGEVRITVDWSLRPSPTSVSGTVELKDMPLERGYPLWVGKPLSYRHPSLEKISFSGLLSGKAEIRKGAKDLELRGRLRTQDLEVRFKDPDIRFRGVKLDLPLRFASSVSGTKELVDDERGMLSLDGVDTPWFEVPPFSVPFTGGMKGYTFLEAVKIPLWGGEAVLRSFTVGDLRQGFHLEGDLSLNQLDLEKVLKRKEVAGSLSGELGPILLDREKAEIGGTWKALLFDGTVEGKNVWIRKPFAPDRTLGGEMDFSGLNLEIITRLFSFGKITGFLEGWVKDLVLRGKMPQRFHLWARTQDRPGVPKRINVKAIENIGLLGTGWGEMDTLRKGINRFISEYAYREIGFSCSLRDDVFSLRGTIIEDGVEYLVRKPAFWGIDVINKNPDNEILFSDIMERLRRIGNRSQEGSRYEFQ